MKLSLVTVTDFYQNLETKRAKPTKPKDIHRDLVIFGFGHWVFQKCLPKIKKQKLLLSDWAEF